MSEGELLPRVTLPEGGGTHARLSASSAHRWMACPASITFCETSGAANTSSVYAAEGTFAHHILASCLLAPDALKPEDWLGMTAKIEGFDIECTEEMIEAVDAALACVYENYDPESDELFVETDFTEELKPLHPDFGGSADICILQRDTQRLLVYDYKHGAGVPVSPEGNKQLRYYALGALLATKAPVTEVEVGIIQPRYAGGDDPLQTWTFQALDLIDFAADLREAAAAVDSKNPPFNPGEDQCRWCPGRGTCPELQAAQDLVMSEKFDLLVEPVVGEVDLDKLAEALSILPLVEQRISRLREIAYEEGLKGSPPPGWKLVDKRATRKWKSEEEALEVFEGLLGEKAKTEPKLKSPAQIEKLLKGEEKKQVEGLVEKVSSGYTLVPESDKRKPAMLVSPDDFDNLEDK